MIYEIIAIINKETNQNVWCSARSKKEAIKKAKRHFLRGGEVITRFKPAQEIIIRPYYDYYKREA